MPAAKRKSIGEDGGGLLDDASGNPGKPPGYLDALFGDGGQGGGGGVGSSAPGTSLAAEMDAELFDNMESKAHREDGTSRAKDVNMGALVADNRYGGLRGLCTRASYDERRIKKDEFHAIVAQDPMQVLD